HHFPFLELMSNIRRTNRDVVRGPLAFVADQAEILNPITLPLWVAGLAWLLFSSAGKRWLVLGWTYCVMLATFIVLHGKNYYLAPAYPMLFAAGAVAFERFSEKRLYWSRVAYASLMIISGVGLASLSAPTLSPEGYVRFQEMLGVEPIRAENQRTGPLPQHFADE